MELAEGARFADDALDVTSPLYWSSSMLLCVLDLRCCGLVLKSWCAGELLRVLGEIDPCEEAEGEPEPPRHEGLLRGI